MLDRIRYWEYRRLYYNLVLAAVFAFWVAMGWTHFHGAFTFPNLVALVFLAFIANLMYCAAYPVDFIFENLSFGELWRRYRFGLWIAGTLLAIVLESYWVNDEILPGLR